LQLLGSYHSPPHGANEPSRTDVERAYYPDAAYFIISPHADAVKPVRAFAIRDGVVSELQVSLA
jgi:proteasome lid subunit RPN8/RPN11